jgi:Zn-dependent M28 family amino/carboxypeptidase
VGAVVAGGAACQRAAGGGAEFSGARALGYVERQLAFGPRIPNTPAHRAAGDWLLAELRQRADTVIVQAFTQETARGETLALRNFLARFRPAASERILLLAHWDTRPRSDQAADTAARRLPVPGANDGASGVAILLGVADALKASPPAVGVDLLLVDGEDYGSFSDSTETLLGSRYFAAQLTGEYQPMFAVLFDMVGDRDLQIYQEGNSLAFAPEVVKRVWRVAEELGHGRVFVPAVRHTLSDDHVPLQLAGIRAIDVVDFDYPFWHTPHDTIDKVSAASLQIVGEVALALVR